MESRTLTLILEAYIEGKMTMKEMEATVNEFGSFVGYTMSHGVRQIRAYVKGEYLTSEALRASNESKPVKPIKDQIETYLLERWHETHALSSVQTMYDILSEEDDFFYMSYSEEIEIWNILNANKPRS